jgi:GPH family glycoside/pentoside/hexuronide:cation symporter
MIFGTVYSIFNNPYGSMIPAMTRHVIERSDLASSRWAGANTGLLLTTMLFMPIVLAFNSMQTGYVVAAAVFALAGLGLQLICYANVKERYSVTKPNTGKGAILKDYKSLFKNAPLLVLCIVNLLTFSAFNVKLAVQVYYCQYSLHNTLIIRPMGFFAIGCVYIGVILTPLLVRRFGKKATYILGAVIWAVADLLAWFFANTTISFIIFACFAFFGSSFINTLNWALISDAVEYGEWKTGNRSEGLVYSSFTFFRKLSQAIAGFVPGIVLTMVGYVANTEQTTKALTGIKGLMFIYPGVLAIATFIIMYFCYKLTDTKCKEIIAELNERKIMMN